MDSDPKSPLRIPRGFCFLLGFLLPGASMFLWGYFAFGDPLFGSLISGFVVGLVCGILSALFGERVLNFLMELV